jgi:hypothetical protein
VRYCDLGSRNVKLVCKMLSFVLNLFHYFCRTCLYGLLVFFFLIYILLLAYGDFINFVADLV